MDSAIQEKKQKRKYESFLVCTVQGKYVPYSYEEKMAYAMVEFSENTSAHGIPQIRASTSVFKVYWTLLYMFCLGMFLYQAVSVVEKYQRNEKIVDIELSAFDSAMVEAAGTVGEEEEGHRKKRSSDNRNEALFKKNNKDAKETLRIPKFVILQNLQNLSRYSALFESSPTSSSYLRKGEAGLGAGSTHPRYKRGGPDAMFEPAMSDCDCSKKADDGHCHPYVENVPSNEKKPPCLCAFDRAVEDAWPCHEFATWEKKICKTCDGHGFCPPVPIPGKKGSRSACFCNTAGMGFCVAYPEGSQIMKLWEYYGNGPPTEDPLFLEALGFGGMTDEIAIVTKAKENVMFAMSSLTVAQRKEMSYTKEEMIHKCSFNGGACDIANDFRPHMDPTFGSCYTFNWNLNGSLTSNRAGPMYGLRMLIYVNTTEYMPTTEAAGVRITVHEKSSFPFPDTFGYSAPTGFISSFGIRLKSVHRLPAPYGNCVPREAIEGYIYEGYDYSTEGCFRSCFQQLVMRSCSCGDPRFPVLDPYKHCDVADPVARRCLGDVTDKLGDLHSSDTFKCNCQQPCVQSTYDVTYSASKWPSKSLKVQLGSCTGSTEECVEHYKEHGAMIEVFYEQLNFEMLSESQAYGWVNLLADFGGQLGLWLGVSVLTCFEFFMLIWRLIFLTAIHQYEEYKKRQAEKERIKQHGL